MVRSGVRKRSGRADRAPGPMFDLVAAKLLRPVVRIQTVRHSLLTDGWLITMPALSCPWLLMREIDDVLRRRPDLGTPIGEAEALRRQQARQCGTGTPGASALTTTELCLLPMLATHLSFPDIAGELSLSRHTIKSPPCRCTGSWGPSPAARRSPGAGR